MEIATNTTTQTNAQTSSAASDKDVVNSDYTTFLKMLTAQVKNQDPLEPMSSENFSTQLATFSGVEQQVKTNDLLVSLAAQMGNMGMAQLAGWIGLDARAAAPAFFEGSPVKVFPNPDAGADHAVLVVRDQTGIEIQRQSFVPSSDEMLWAGVGDDGAPFDGGFYSFEVESYSGDEFLSTTKAEVYSEVVEAKRQDGETVVVLAAGTEILATNIAGLRGSS